MNFEFRIHSRQNQIYFTLSSTSSHSTWVMVEWIKIRLFWSFVWWNSRKKLLTTIEYRFQLIKKLKVITHISSICMPFIKSVQKMQTLTDNREFIIEKKERAHRTHNHWIKHMLLRVISEMVSNFSIAIERFWLKFIAFFIFCAFVNVKGTISSRRIEWGNCCEIVQNIYSNAMQNIWLSLKWNLIIFFFYSR